MRSGLPALSFAATLLGAAALSISAAFAAKVPTPLSNDLFIGFRATGGTGSDFAYLVKIGTYNTFRDVPEGSTITISTVNIGTTANPNIVSIGNIGADLSSLTALGQGFGPNWHTREDVQWGIFGWGSNQTDPVLFASQQRPSLSVASPPWDQLTPSERRTTRGEISTVLTSESGAGANPYALLDATANSPVGGFQSSAEGSYIDKVSGSPDFGSLSGFQSIEASFQSGPANALLDLYRLGPTGATIPSVLHVGYFSISSSGVITFTKPSSTPQPDPNADDDGDGFTNGQEAIAGTNPNDPNDFFKIDTVSRSSGNSLISFKPAAGRTYLFRYSENLQPPWETIETWPAGATPPSLHTFVDSDPVRTARAKGFYQIVVSQP